MGDFASEGQTAVSDDSGAEVRQPDEICNLENAEELEQRDRNKSENSIKQIEEIAKAEMEVEDEVNDDQSVISYLDEDETLIQDVEKSDMVEEAQPWTTRELGGVKVKAPGGDVDQVSVTSNSLRDDPAGQGEGLSRTDEAAGNLNDTRENA